MQAIVLAAGYGRRMRPLSDERHKALLPIGGTTVLGRILDSLQAAKVEKVLVVTGYRAEDVRSFVAAHDPRLEIRCVHNERFATTNNIVSLALALEALESDEDVLLIECDLIFDPALLTALVARRSGNVALVDRYSEGMDGTVVAVADGRVSAVYPPSAQGDDFSYRDKFKTLNIYRFERAFCADTLSPLLASHAREVDANAYYELVLGTLADLPGQEIHAELVDGSRWAEVDDPNDLLSARFVFEPRRRAELLDRTHGGNWNYDLLDFAHIRNAHYPTPAMLAALAHALPALVANYGSAQSVLNEKLSWFLLADASRLQALNGAAQALPILARQLAGLRAALPAPTFGEYPRLFTAERTYRDRPGVDLAELDTIAGEVELLVVVNPNNPTGTAVATSELHALASRHPGTTLLVDESFQIFSGQRSLMSRLEEEPLRNVIVVSSLSKSLGVPGLRLGYLYCTDAPTLARFAAELPIWNLGAPAEFFLELALKFRPELEQSIEQTLEDRAQLAGALAGSPLVATVHPSAANFLLVTLAADAPAVASVREALLTGVPAINVRDVSERLGDGASHLRIAVRTRAENGLLLDALAGLAETLR